ncbi:MAG: hypothetical protein RL172_582 [Bacteroidota bacterium]
MLKIVLLYTPLQLNIAFLQLKQDYVDIPAWRISFFVHVFSSMLVLLAGFTQFSSQLRQQQPRLHRAMGYLYVLIILLVTGPAGLIMSFYANGGWLARVAFIVLSVLWMGFTARATYSAIKKDFTAHRHWMIRSFALTLSALTLRMWKVVLATITEMPPMTRYRLIAWLGWGVNLLLAEYLIRKSRQRSMTAA